MQIAVFALAAARQSEGRILEHVIGSLDFGVLQDVLEDITGKSARAPAGLFGKHPPERVFLGIKTNTDRVSGHVRVLVRPSRLQPDGGKWGSGDTSPDRVSGQSPVRTHVSVMRLRSTGEALKIGQFLTAGHTRNCSRLTTILDKYAILH